MEEYDLSTPIQASTAVLNLAQASLQPEDLRDASPYARCLLGLTQLALDHARALSWALDAKNRSAAQVSARVFLELVFNLTYINEYADFRDYRASLLLLEGFERELDIHRGAEAQDDHEVALLVGHLEREIQQRRVEMRAMKRGPKDPSRWKHGKVWERAKASRWKGAYNSLYARGSGYVHSDGLAILDQLRPGTGVDEAMAAWCANFIMFIADQMFKTFPLLTTSPALTDAWNRLVDIQPLWNGDPFPEEA